MENSDYKKTGAMKTKKQISIKPFIKIIKELKEKRTEGQKRVIGFNEELSEKIKRQNILVQELGEVQNQITQLRHLIEMYRVMDRHRIMYLWKLETACGLTNKKYTDWEFDFRRTKDGWIFKS